MLQVKYTILDCYTDEAAGLGVPPYLGTYPRYIFGMLKEKDYSPSYITIDDVRFNKFYENDKKNLNDKHKTNIRVYNTTRSDITKILAETETLIVILGIHVPGKYLSAIPGTLKEITKFLKGTKCKKILTGPAVYGTQLEGGKYFEKIDLSIFSEIKQFGFEFGPFKKEMNKHAVLGAEIIKQIPQLRIIEIETGRGCNVGKCSFCTEPIKNNFSNRTNKDIIAEIKAFYKLGARYFRLGKQSDFFSIENPIALLKTLAIECPDIEVLHIDNVNPVFVVSKQGKDIAKAVVKYCTPGNIAAFGVESFDENVVRENKLNTKPNIALRAIKILNEIGGDRGWNGMPNFLPGINIIFGLGAESKHTHERNMNAFSKIMEEGWMLRRINIRQVSILPNTYLEKKFGAKYLLKNKKYYWKWRREIREKVDYPMLKKIVPVNTIMKRVYTEVHDGKITFGRQIGTYPLIVGIKEKVPLNKFVDVKITGHMLRSITGEIVKQNDIKEPASFLT